MDTGIVANLKAALTSGVFDIGAVAGFVVIDFVADAAYTAIPMDRATMLGRVVSYGVVGMRDVAKMTLFQLANMEAKAAAGSG